MRLSGLWIWLFYCFTSFCAAGEIELTPAETQWIEDNPVIRVARDPDYAPFEFKNAQGEVDGFAKDILAFCAQQVGLKIQDIQPNSWSDALALVKQRQADLVTVATITPERQDYLRFTESYISLPVVIITRTDIKENVSLHSLRGQSLATVPGFAINNYLEQYAKNVDIKLVNSVEEGLQQVSLGQINAMVLNLGTASYKMQELKLINLRVAGITDYTYHLSFAVRSDYPVLRSILNKALLSIPEMERQKIINQRLTLESYIWKPGKLEVTVFIAVLISIAFVVMLYWNRALKQQVKVRTSEIESKSLSLEEQIEERKILEQKLTELALHDPLTGLANRRKLLDRVRLEWSRSLRSKSPISLLLLDLDEFKNINDNYGHDVGDAVLKTVAEILTETLRDADMIARWGGEEFVILLPETELSQAGSVAERVRRKVENSKLAVGDVRIKFTVSIGFSTNRGGDKSFDTLLKLAEQFLSQAKQSGRNKVCGN
ncbi:MAG: diguanylate cyclase [Kangiellaceae bacterium]|nr:diguanylate cyclase [Kangiellaceae bacterium]MCW8999680.1 diguanylate cyclase [Kangiellaceae bacterium]